MLVLALAGLARSATNTVTSLADSGAGSLRQVIANSAAGDSIVFGVTGTITLAGSELVVDKDLTLIGPGAAALGINGAGASRIFNIQSNAAVLIAGLTITNGLGENGGGIYNVGTLTLDSVILSGNRTATGTNGVYVPPYYPHSGGAGGSGGGIWNGGTCLANRCSFSGNSTGGGGFGSGGKEEAGGGGTGGSGGGIYNAGTMALTNCTVSKNSCGAGGAGGHASLGAGWGGAGGSGGGICSPGHLVLAGCAIANNQTGLGGDGGWSWSSAGGMGGNGGAGGGICARSLLALTNCTLAGNSCGRGGAEGEGVYGFGGGVGGSGGGICCTGATVVSCTIVSNAVGWGLPGRYSGTSDDGFGGGVWYYYGGGGFFLNDIVALNSALTNGEGPDIWGTFNSLGHNLIGATNDSSGFTVPGDRVGSSAFPLDPKVAPLADNGGPTLTMALLPGSPAIDAGDTSLGPATDQRGSLRPAGAASDIGAYELCYPRILRITPPQAGSITIQAFGANGQACRLLWSPDLSDWVPLATNQIGGDGTVLFYDEYAPGAACRFYRLVMP